jgi:hypothetical protein
MQTRTVALAGGAIVVVGAALGGGYYFGRGEQAPTQVVQAQTPGTSTAPQTPSDRMSSEPAPSAQQTAMQPPYESARYSSAPTDRAPYAQSHRRLSRASFHEALAPYGRWQYSDRWGEVWQPENVEQDFRPYDRRGHWTNTHEYGWTWVSDYEWGSIPFHYGRWVDDPDRGWLWVPGYVWGPGWVVWRSGDRHTGWMPMPPDREFARGDETYRNDWRDDSDYGYRDWYGPRYDAQRAASHWVFVDTGHVADRDYRRYEVSRTDEVQALISHTSNTTNYVTLNNHVVNQSIDVHAVEQASGHKVEVVPASVVLTKPELVTSVDVGKQAQIQARQELPTGSGKPNSAPPASQLPASGQAAASQAGAQPAQSGASGNNSPTTSAATTPAPKPGDENQNVHHDEHGPATTNVATAPASPAGNENQHARHEAHESAAPAMPTGSETAKGSGASQQAGTGGVNNAASNSTAYKAGRTPSKEAVVPAAPGKNATAPEAGAPKPGIENWRRRHRPEDAQQGNEKAATGAAAPATAAGANAPDATLANGEFPRRHPGRRAAMEQGGPDQAPTDSTAAAPAHETGSQRTAQGNEAQPQSGSEQNAGSSSPEHVKKHKLIVPASVEPSANAHKNAESAPATDVRTQSPPADNGANDESKAKKGRHKTDEPGPGSAPPP